MIHGICVYEIEISLLRSVASLGTMMNSLMFVICSLLLQSWIDEQDQSIMSAVTTHTDDPAIVLDETRVIC